LGTKDRLPCRLLAKRVPAEVAEKRRERLRERQRRKGRKYRDADPWALAEWTLYATNVPEAMLRVDEALVLATCRWQIELLWKLWKSQGRIDESRSNKPWRILCEIYAKLLGMAHQLAGGSANWRYRPLSCLSKRRTCSTCDAMPRPRKISSERPTRQRLNGAHSVGMRRKLRFG